MKRDSGLFIFMMAVYDRVEVSELVGNYLLYELSKLYEKNDIRLYRDNGLAVCKNKRGLELEKIKKSVQFIFLENNLKTSI